MARFASIAKGRRARKRVALPIGNEIVELDVRVLGPDEDIDIAADAQAFAKAKGVTNAVPGDEIYDRAKRAFTLLRACVDYESPEDSPVQFFASVDEILTSKCITRDHIAYLFEQQDAWQDETSPRRRQLSMQEYVGVVAKAVEGDIGPFALLGPGAQWSCFAHTAKQLFDLQTHKSPSSSTSEETSR